MQVAEISCGQCQFSLNNQKGYDLAIRIDNQAHFLDGFDIDAFGDAHEKHTGFCEVIRIAEVSGLVKNDRYQAETVKLIEIKK
jgi:hypothetical protein